MQNKLLFIILVLVLISGCSTMKVPAKVTHPAEVDMTSHKKIAIMDIAGNYGDQFRDTIKARLAASGQFDIQNCASKVHMVEVTEEVEVPNPNYKRRMSDMDKAVAIVGFVTKGELNLPNEPKTITKMITKQVALKELPEECKDENLQVSAVIKGSYNGNYKTNLESTKATCKSKERGEYACLSYTRKASVNISGSIDVINSKTGDIIATKTISDKCQDTTWSRESEPRIIEERNLKNNCVSRNATTFSKTLTPWTETVMVAYTKDSDLPQLEQGAKLVELGRYEQAIETFQAAIKTAERNMLKPKIVAKGYWNLGLAYEYSWQFDKALEAFDKGYLLHTDKKFISEKHNTKMLMAKREKLLQQQKKALAAADE